MSMQATWKPWPHCGSTRISSPTSNSARQIAQSENLAEDSAEKVALGRDLRIFFLRPLLAGGVGRGVSAGLEAELPESRRSQAQRATAMRPSTQIRAQRRAARITTKSESTVAPCSGGGGGGSLVAEELAAPRSLKGRVM